MDILISEEKGVRMLHFGSDWVQGAMRIARPYALELEYTREMMAPLLFRPEPTWPRSALFIGLGVGALPKFLHKHRPDCKITVVEISEEVLAVAQTQFKLPPLSMNFNVEIACGADYMARTNRTFDLIMVDGFDGKAKVGPLNSSVFYLALKSRLSSDGFAVFNLLSNQKDTEPNKRRLADAFDDRLLMFPPCSSGNVIALASTAKNWGLNKEAVFYQVADLKEKTGLNLSLTAAKLQALLEA
jgi:spermidine synthase